VASWADVGRPPHPQTARGAYLAAAVAAGRRPFVRAAIGATLTPEEFAEAVAAVGASLVAAVAGGVAATNAPTSVNGGSGSGSGSGGCAVASAAGAAPPPTAAALADAPWALDDAAGFGLVRLFSGAPERAAAGRVFDALAAAGAPRVPPRRARYGV